MVPQTSWVPLARPDSSVLVELESLVCGIAEVNVQRIAGTFVDSLAPAGRRWGWLWACKHMVLDL